MGDKEQQLPLMADICKQSSRLIIWLGAAEEGWLAVNVVHRVLVWSRLRASNGLEPDVVVSSQVARKVLIKLLLHPWFSRTWVVQEIAMGARMDWGDKAWQGRGDDCDRPVWYPRWHAWRRVVIC